jgi:hypothetical protein
VASDPRVSGAPPVDFDLDEDLFDFEEVTSEKNAAEEEADLDEILASFQDPDLEAGQPAPRSAPTPPPAPQSARAAPLAPIVRPSDVARVPVHAPNSDRHEGGSAPASPVAVPVAAALPRSFFWLFLAVLCTNALLAVVSLKSTNEVQNRVEEVGDRVREAADEVRSSVQSNAQARIAAQTPITAPSPEDHPAFEQAVQEIERGAFAAARQRLYALLAIVDRLDPQVRESVEARANFLLARALHLQALQLARAESMGEPHERGRAEAHE